MKKKYDFCILIVDSLSIDLIKVVIIGEIILVNVFFKLLKWGSYFDYLLEEVVDIVMSWLFVVKCMKLE